MNLSILKPFLLLLLAGFISEYAAAQPGAIYGRSRGKDFATITLGDTISFDGEFEKPRAWPAEVRIKRAGQREFEVYKAGEATELVINDKEQYVAVELDLKNGDRKFVFAKVRSLGRVNLYESRVGISRFFLLDEDITYIFKDSTDSVINQLAGPCETQWCSWQRATSYPGSILLFFRQYNKGDLHVRFPLPQLSFFLQTTHSRYYYSRFFSTATATEPAIINGTALAPGLALYIPFYPITNLGVDVKFSLHKMVAHSDGIIYTQIDTQRYRFYEISTSCNRWDFALRYSFYLGSFEPFITAGISYLVQNNFESETYIKFQNSIGRFDPQSNFITEPGNLTGIFFQPGILLNLSTTYSLSAQIGYTRFPEKALGSTNSRLGLDNLFFELSYNIHFPGN